MLRSTSVTRIRASLSPRTVASPAKPIPTTMPRGPARREAPSRALFARGGPTTAPDEGAGRDVAVIGGVPPEHPGRSRFGAGQADADDPGGGAVARRVRVDRLAQQDPDLGHLRDRNRR